MSNTTEREALLAKAAQRVVDHLERGNALHPGGPMHLELRTALAATPAQPVEPSEREAFEAHTRSTWKVPADYLDWALKRNERGDYQDSRAADQWGGWQARAALAASQPAPDAIPLSKVQELINIAYEQGLKRQPLGASPDGTACSGPAAPEPKVSALRVPPAGASPPCRHDRTDTTQQGITYMDWKCRDCGATGRTSWD